MYEGMILKETSTSIQTTTPESVFSLFKDSGQLAQETFSIATLNTKNMVIKTHLISLGTVNSALVHPREVYKPAILDGASSIIITHNHPSGSTTPSAEDVKITKQLVEAGKIIGINILDHVIIGDDKFLSLRESGLVKF